MTVEIHTKYHFIFLIELRSSGLLCSKQW